MEDLDDGTGRLVSSRRHLPNWPGRVFKDLNRSRSEATSPSTSAPSTPQMMVVDCGAPVQPTIMDSPLQASDSGVDVQMMDFSRQQCYQYIQYPIENCFENVEQLPLAYMMFPDSHVTSIQLQLASETVVSVQEGPKSSCAQKPTNKRAVVKKAKVIDTHRRPRSGKKKISQRRKKTTR